MNKILVVDDDNAIRLLYQEELENDGYRIVTFSDYKNLLTEIARHCPDVIIIGITMGETNGLDIIRDIRNIFIDIPIILCSASSTFESVAKSFDADYFVTKSSDLNELKNKITMSIGRYTYPG